MPISPSPAVVRACTLLQRLAADPGESFTTSELARDAGFSRASCDAVLLALADQGFVQRSATDRRYRIGPACATLADAARVADAPLVAVDAVADDLARTLGANAALCRRDGDVVRVERVHDHGPTFGTRARVGDATRLAAPFGAVFVAWDDDHHVAAWCEPAGADRAHLLDALAAVRTRGFAVAAPASERVGAPGGVGGDRLVRPDADRDYLPPTVDPGADLRVSHLSLPVFDHHGRVAMSIMVFGPFDGVTAGRLDALAGAVLDASRRATAAIGGTVPGPDGPEPRR